MGPSPIEQAWTAFFTLVLIVSVSQYFVAMADYRRKRDEARHKNGNARAAAKLARLLAWSVLLDSVAAFAWMSAGTLSVIRYYVELLDLPEDYLVLLLFIGAAAFGGRVFIRAYTRLIVNKL